MFARQKKSAHSADGQNIQNSGIGRETMLLAEHFLAENGYAAVRLDAFAQNPHAIRLYQSMGYKCAGKALFRKGEFYLFEKQLKPTASF